MNHYCVEGWTAVAEFTGVPFANSPRMGADPKARYVDFQSFDDGYHESWDVESAMHPQTLIVYGKDGAPLTPAYGGPARVHSPVKLGLQEHQVPDQDRVHARAKRRVWTDRGYEWYGGI